MEEYADYDNPKKDVGMRITVDGNKISTTGTLGGEDKMSEDQVLGDTVEVKFDKWTGTVYMYYKFSIIKYLTFAYMEGVYCT